MALRFWYLDRLVFTLSARISCSHDMVGARRGTYLSLPKEVENARLGAAGSLSNHRVSALLGTYITSGLVGLPVIGQNTVPSSNTGPNPT
jgi:hypothetical protein